MNGLVISAPTSGEGKTTLTLGILRALRNQEFAVRSAKSGPDYIDPKFHAAASGAPCVNLDAWAMSPQQIMSLTAGDAPLVIEGAMGLFDGAANGTGSTADLARLLGVPVVLIIDASKQAQSVAPLVAGFAKFDASVRVAGIILNKVGSARHERILRSALEPLNIPVLGSIPRSDQLHLPSRHLGLVQAQEHTDLDAFLENAANHVKQHVDLEALKSLMDHFPTSKTVHKLIPPAQHIAIAQDTAFAFCYPHVMEGWRANGAQISTFSPLNNEAPNPSADLVYLPGGYPELHAGTLSNNTHFLDGVRKAKQVYGECGGYMVMGDGVIDADGVRHAMLGLLRLETSFQTRKLHLGYRQLNPKGGPWAKPQKAHEFHYATTMKADGDPLFDAQDAEGTPLPAMGLQNGTAYGSFAHLIDWAL